MLLQLSRDCKVEVQRILHQRALDVKLDPELQRRCMTDLGKWCSEKTEAGQELECLQDHLEDLVPNCRDVVGNLTELESEVNGHACFPQLGGDRWMLSRRLSEASWRDRLSSRRIFLIPLKPRSLK